MVSKLWWILTFFSLDINFIWTIHLVRPVRLAGFCVQQQSLLHSGYGRDMPSINRCLVVVCARCMYESCIVGFPCLRHCRVLIYVTICHAPEIVKFYIYFHISQICKRILFKKLQKSLAVCMTTKLIQLKLTYFLIFRYRWFSFELWFGFMQLISQRIRHAFQFGKRYLK